MNFKQSPEILDKFNSATKILVNCHHKPDADSVGSALAMASVLKFIGKEVKIICPSEIPSTLHFLYKYYEVQPEVIDFNQFDFSQWDLLLTLDSSAWDRVAGRGDIPKPDNLQIIVIDHHETNTKFGNINLVHPEYGANSELLYHFLSDIKYELGIEFNNPNIAPALLTGIIGDTGGLRFPEADRDTVIIASDLMQFADKNEIIFNLYQQYSLQLLEFWGEILKNLKVDEEGKFAWSAVNRETYAKYGRLEGSKSEIADKLFQSIEGTDFGMVIVEENEGYVGVSLRSRTGFDVSKIAVKLSGGGHVYAAAGRLEGKNFDEAVSEILQIARETINEKVL